MRLAKKAKKPDASHKQVAVSDAVSKSHVCGIRNEDLVLKTHKPVKAQKIQPDAAETLHRQFQEWKDKAGEGFL